MSIACSAAALSALASAALQNPADNSPAQGGFAQTPAAHADQSGVSDSWYARTPYFNPPSAAHALELRAESHPVRFHTEPPPAFVLAAPREDPKTAPAVELARAAPPKPKTDRANLGGLSDLSDNVQALVDYYEDEMVWRPISVDGGGGGVQYRLKFGAKPSN